MEKTISTEERIRRAEELYLKRKKLYENVDYRKRFDSNKQKESKENSIKHRIKRKLWIQIISCMLIYFSFYSVLNSNYFFSERARNKIEEFLLYDIDFKEFYNRTETFFKEHNDIFKNFFIAQKSKLENEIEDEEKNIEKEEDKDRAKADNNTQDEFIEENIESNENISESNESTENNIEENNKTQEELDAEYIREKYGIIWPVNGIITSRYGPRTPTEIVSANHSGLDIGSTVGTEIVAAIDGTVTLVSETGDYGKHIQIDNDDISTLYAHCSKLLVSNGEDVIKGQKIAEVGKTGRATGPHLHFEIKRNGKTIDPELVLN